MTCVFLVLTVGCQYQIHFNSSDGNRKIEVLQTRIIALQKQTSDLRHQNRVLNLQLQDVRDSSEYIEEQARKILLMINPGEIFVMPVDLH